MKSGVPEHLRGFNQDGGYRVGMPLGLRQNLSVLNDLELITCLRSMADPWGALFNVRLFDAPALASQLGSRGEMSQSNKLLAQVVVNTRELSMIAMDSLLLARSSEVERQMEKIRADLRALQKALPKTGADTFRSKIVSLLEQGDLIMVAVKGVQFTQFLGLVPTFLEAARQPGVQGR